MPAPSSDISINLRSPSILTSRGPCRHVRICRTSFARALLKGVSSGFGYIAFAGLSTLAAAADRDRKRSPLAARVPHFPAKAKRVIFLCMHGAPSHVDTFDFKPRLTADTGKPSPVARLNGAKLLGSPWEFKQYGQSGQWISELFPEVAGHADELCMIRSMHTDLPAHPQAFLMMHTGNSQFVRPSLGAWTLYGLGTENENLPGFIALKPLSPTADRRTTAMHFCRRSTRGPVSATKWDPSRTRGWEISRILGSTSPRSAASSISSSR